MSVKFSGPLFDAPRATIRTANRKALSTVGTQISATIKLKTPRDTGRFVAAIEREVWRNANGVTVKADYSGPKIRTWLETGKRNGVKTQRKGSYMFRAGKTKAKQINYQSIVGAEIAKLLNG